jgi:hypothetical protein
MTHMRLYGGPLDGLEVPAGDDILQLPLEEVPGRIAVYRMEGDRFIYLGTVPSRRLQSKAGASRASA